MADVDVARVGERRFRVIVSDSRSTSTHEVTVGDDEPSLVPAGGSAQDLVEASFRFLLDREPKESIMTSFDLRVIGRYFPEWEDRIGEYL